MVKEKKDSDSNIIDSADTTRSEKVVLNCFREYMKKLLRCFKPKNKKKENSV